jgi:hypothetical protein
VPSQANLIPLDLPEMGRLEFTPERSMSVRVGGSTPPDNSRLTTPKARVVRGVAFLRNCRQLLRIEVFNPRRNCTGHSGGMATKISESTVKVKKPTAFPLGVKPEALGLFRL